MKYGLPKPLHASHIASARKARTEGVEQTTRLHNYQIEVLILLAVKELYAGGYNNEVKSVVENLYELQKKGFFSNDHS